jgi:transcriptional regulator with XRE-family HTH domain
LSLINAAKIVAYRKGKNWNQSELAKAAQVDVSIISRVERGLQTDGALSTFAAIARALNTTVDDLLIDSQEITAETTHFELQEVILELLKKPLYVQRQAAGILRGYLSTLNQEE